MPDALITLLPSIVERLRSYQERGVVQEISLHDNMFQGNREHYFAVGRDAIAIIALAMMKARIDSFATVLDFPCGSGRVLRHLVRFLPEAHVVASDIDPEHVKFCVQQFGAAPLLSQEEIGKVTLDRPVDLLWCGSLLTHLPADRFKGSLCQIVDWLAPGGIAIVTLHGRWPLRRQIETSYKYIDEGVFAPIAHAVMRDGFGYADYPTVGDHIGQESYGFSVSLPSWVMHFIETMDNVRLIDYMERGWDKHQDVMILRKTPIAAPPWKVEASHQV